VEWANDIDAVRILVRDDGETRIRLDAIGRVASLPFTRAASAALRRPAPMLAATSSTVTG